jgi:DNA-binding beta-propeller fold protein YncE
MCVVLICPSAVRAGQWKLYWSDQYDTWMRRANLNGTDAEKIVAVDGASPDIAFDPVEQKMYWPAPVVGGIQRGNYDGSDAETVFTGLEMPTHVSIDPVNRKAYWIDYGAWIDFGWGNSIWRSNLDGTDRELLADNIPSPAAVEIDPLGGHYYWVDSISGTIHRTSIADNTQSDVIFDENAFDRPTFIKGLAIDPVNGYAYAADRSFHAIIRVPLDGREAVDWITDGVFSPDAIVVDRKNERVIWSNSNLTGPLTESANISSVNFLGLDQRIDFVPLLDPYIAGWVRHLAIVEVPVPEPSTFTLVIFATLVLSHSNCRVLRAATPDQKHKCR